MIGPARGKIRVRYGSAPERAEELLGRVRATVADLVREGPRSGEVAKEKEIQRRELETRLRRNGFWLGSLAGLRIRQRPLREVQDRMTRIEELTAEELHRVFREHFSSGRHTAVIWKPQEEQEPEGTR